MRPKYWTKLNVVGGCLFLVLCLFLTACHSQQKTLAEKLYAMRTPYIGDNSKVGALVSTVPGYEQFALHTDKEPYGVTVYINKEQLEKYSFEKETAICLGLIKNASFITFTDMDEKTAQNYDVDTLTKTLGYSPKVFYEEEDKLEKFLNLNSQS